MTSLEDKAAGGGHEIVLVADQEALGWVSVLDPNLFEADELSPEGQFPQHGDFLMTEGHRSGDETYLECPQALAASLVEAAGENEVEVTELSVNVSQVHKSAGGAWKYVLDVKPTEDV